MSYDLAEKDLAHIGSVLCHLESSADGARISGASTAIGLDYWRGRIRAILAMPRLPMHVEKQAKDLLGRLDRLEDSHGEAATIR